MKVTFTDPASGEPVDFTVEEQTVIGGTGYLLVSEDTDEENCEAYILKELPSEDEEALYEMVSDETELAAIAKVFSELSEEGTNIIF